MENILCLIGGALIGIIIGANLKERNPREIKLLHKILDRLPEGSEGDLEKQMDSWLFTLDKSIGKIEKVSDQVVSK